MPSGAKMRKASRKKKELEAFYHGSKAETIIQDATGLTRTHLTEGVKSTDGVPESQDKPIKENPSVNIEEVKVVLPLQIKDVDNRDNIEENDERIQDVVVTDNVVIKRGISEIVEMKKEVQIMLEKCSKFKKIIEKQQNAWNKCTEILLKTLDDLNSIQLPEVM